MNTEIGKLLQDAAGIFAQLAAAYENDRKYTTYRLDLIENETYKNREALKSAAELVLEKLKY